MITDAGVVPDVRAFIDQQSVVALATVAMDGTPNVAPMAWKVWHDAQTLLILDNFMRTTLANIRATGVAAVSVWDADTGTAYQVKGTAEYATDGPCFATGAAHMVAKRPGQRPRGVVVVHVTEVFTQQPGEHAGCQLDGDGKVRV